MVSISVKITLFFLFSGCCSKEMPIIPEDVLISYRVRRAGEVFAEPGHGGQILRVSGRDIRAMASEIFEFFARNRRFTRLHHTPNMLELEKNERNRSPNSGAEGDAQAGDPPLQPGKPRGRQLNWERFGRCSKGNQRKLLPVLGP